MIEARKITSSQEQSLLRLQGELEESASAHAASLDRLRDEATAEIDALRRKCAELEADLGETTAALESARIDAELSSRVGAEGQSAAAADAHAARQELQQARLDAAKQAREFESERERVESALSDVKKKLDRTDQRARTLEAELAAERSERSAETEDVAGAVSAAEAAAAAATDARDAAEKAGPAVCSRHFFFLFFKKLLFAASYVFERLKIVYIILYGSSVTTSSSKHVFHLNTSDNSSSN